MLKCAIYHDGTFPFTFAVLRNEVKICPMKNLETCRGFLFFNKNTSAMKMLRISSDAVHTLARALVSLSTDLHGPVSLTKVLLLR